jgi:hypothetical protein
MDDGDLRRPIGWLKEADAALDAFDTAIASAGTTRRGWQILTTLAAAPTPRAELAAGLAGFDDAATVGTVVDDLAERGGGERRRSGRADRRRPRGRGRACGAMTADGGRTR